MDSDDTATSWDSSPSGGPSGRKRQAEAAALDPADLAAFLLPPGSRYTPLAFLGDGGMGRVYKVYDQQLNRVVALKFLARLDKGPLERFLQEGRAQAQIDHPNVCQIYSVDEFKGQPYFSMRFIAGPTLKEAMPQLDLEVKCRIIQKVALAVHGCHALGILHRDIKPGNIMLERRENGFWWPFLLDFGLARDLADEGMTVPGMFMGTPVYCSPEQVEGRNDAVDSRSDVYALGATLFECLTGAPPFPYRGNLAELMQRISTEEAPSPERSTPGLPPDLCTIVNKALEKEPDRRYPTALALAEDLQHFLNHDPILAHGDSFSYRLGKRFRKNRPIALMALGSSLAVLAFGAFGLTLAWRGQVLSQSSQRFGHEAEHMETLLLKAYTLPLHDLRSERALVQSHLDRLQAELPHLGHWSRPAAHLALGRGYLALDRLEEARRELQLGFQGAPADPDTALALGLTLTRLYQAELEGLRGKPLEDRKQALDQELRQPALAFLRRAQGARQEGPAYVEGILALVEERYDVAQAKAREYQAQTPWSYDGAVLEGEVHRALAARAFDRGDFPLTRKELDLGGEALARAQEVARSAPQPRIAEAKRRILGFIVRMDQGQVTAQDRDWALEATRLSLQANPDDWTALSYQAAIHRRWGAHLLGAGQDPSASLEAAIASAEAGLKIRPTDNPLWNNLGTALRNQGDWQLSQGQDPTQALTRAVQALQEALRRPQFKDWLLDSIGCCYGSLGSYQLEHGQNPTPALREAMANLSRAAALKPWVGHATAMGATLQDLATYHTLTGQDPLPTLAEARKAYAAAVALNAHSFLAQLGLGQVLLDLAEAEQLQGHADPASLQEAQAHLHEALALNPHIRADAQAAMARGHALEALGQTDRTQALQAARAALQTGTTAPEQTPDSRIALAEAALMVQQADPRSAAAAQGLREVQAVLAQHPWDGLARYLQSRLLLAGGHRAEAERAFQQACTLNPNVRAAPR